MVKCTLNSIFYSVYSGNTEVQKFIDFFSLFSLYNHEDHLQIVDLKFGHFDTDIEVKYKLDDKIYQKTEQPIGEED